MKRITGIMVTVLFIAIAMSGCGNKTADSTKDVATSTAQATQKPASDGQRGQFGRSDLTGQVEAVKDGQITIKLSKQAERDPSATPIPRDGNQDGNRQGRIQMEYTGESKNIAITGDVKITQFVRGENGDGQRELKIEDVKVGNVVQIWYSDKDKGIVSRINVMPSRNSGNQ